MRGLQFPAEYEAALWAAAERLIGREPTRESRLIPAIVERSHRYTSEREDLRGASDPDADLAARAVFFTVCDAPKIRVPLRELAAQNLLPRRLRVLDVGAGALAMTLGIASEVAGELEVTAVDRDSRALEVGQAALFQLAQGRVKLTTIDEPLVNFAFEPGAFDLVVLGHVLNELKPAERQRVITAALGSIDGAGSVIIIEPATREITRDLHQIRDRVLGDALAHVFAPCTRSIAPCPALADASDWCHEDRVIELSPRAAHLADRTNLRGHGLKFSYLVLRHGAEKQVDSPDAWRVVSRVRKLKGKYECFLCSNAGRERITLLKRHRSAATRAFEQADRGDVLICQPKGNSVTSDTPVI